MTIKQIGEKTVQKTNNVLNKMFSISKKSEFNLISLIGAVDAIAIINISIFVLIMNMPLETACIYVAFELFTIGQFILLYLIFAYKWKNQK